MNTKRFLLLAGLVLAFAFVMVAGAQAANTKYTFNDVTIDEQVVEIEAAVKTNKKNDFSKCTYFTDDYEESLGYYEDDVDAGDSAAEVLDFCVNHFDERVQ